jgi:hypothetical protein
MRMPRHLGHDSLPKLTADSSCLVAKNALDFEVILEAKRGAFLAVARLFIAAESDAHVPCRIVK